MMVPLVRVSPCDCKQRRSLRRPSWFCPRCENRRWSLLGSVVGSATGRDREQSILPFVLAHLGSDTVVPSTDTSRCQTVPTKVHSLKHSIISFPSTSEMRDGSPCGGRER